MDPVFEYFLVIQITFLLSFNTFMCYFLTHYISHLLCEMGAEVMLRLVCPAQGLE